MSTTTAEAETPETTGGDGPLLDLTDAAVKKFIKQAKARGYVTMDELNKVLPSEEVTSEAIEDTLATNEEIEKLQRRVAEELGFDLVDHRLELYGVPKGGKKPVPSAE